MANLRKLPQKPFDPAQELQDPSGMFTGGGGSVYDEFLESPESRDEAFISAPKPNLSPIKGALESAPQEGEVIPGRSGESPRERAEAQWNATPPQPRQPTPQAGKSGVIPFQPIADTMSPGFLKGSVGAMATPKLRGLYGSVGGLKGGGLGVPLDPVPNEASNSIDTLLKMLQGFLGRGAGRF